MLKAVKKRKHLNKWITWRKKSQFYYEVVIALFEVKIFSSCFLCLVSWSWDNHMSFLKNKIHLITAMGTNINRYKLCKSIKNKIQGAIKTNYLIYKIRKIKYDSFSTIKYPILEHLVMQKMFFDFYSILRVSWSVISNTSINNQKDFYQLEQQHSLYCLSSFMASINLYAVAAAGKNVCYCFDLIRLLYFLQNHLH